MDHILIGPGGVITLETKSISKPVVEPLVIYDGETVLVDGFKPDRDPIVQAKASAQHVCALFAESMNRDVKKIFVRPVVLYPGWFIEGSSSGREVYHPVQVALISER